MLGRAILRRRTVHRGVMTRPSFLARAGVLLAVSATLLASPRVVRTAGAAAAPSHWQHIGLPRTTVRALAVGQIHPGLLFAATEKGLYRRDRRHPWRRVLAGQAVWDAILLHGDRTVIAGDSAGNVDISADGGAHWRQSLVTVTGVYAVTVPPGDPAVLLAGGGGGIYVSRDGGARWDHRLSLPDGTVDAFAWQPGSRRVVFAASVGGSPQAKAGVYISRDAGMTWREYGRHLDSPGGVMSLAVPSGTSVFAGTMGHAVRTVARSGGTWHATASGMPVSNDHVAAMLGIPGRPLTLYAGTLGYGVYVTGDGGRHWTRISRGLPASHNASFVFSIAYSPLDHVLYAGTMDGVYRLRVAGL